VAVELRILGALELIVDGRTVPVGSARQRTLLIALALEAGGSVSTGRLIDALWGEDPPGNALGNLQSYVSRLRKLTGRDLIAFDGSGYRLVASRLSTDLQRVTALVAEARALAGGHPDRAVRLFEEAWSCWRGTALQDVAGLAAFDPDQARLAELRLAIAEDRGELLLGLGRGRELLPDLEGLAGEQPLREPTHILLLRTLAAVGRTAEALRAADRFRVRLAEETGLEPTAELRRWEQLVLNGETVTATAAPRPTDERPRPRPGSLARGGRFFGRTWELQEVAYRMRTAKVLTVTGPGGVGKTRLVAEALARLDLDRPPVVVELAGVDGAAVAAAVAAAVSLATAEGSVVDALAEFLSLERALLVLDNCEHVVDAVANLVTLLTGHCPEVRVLATSRRRLGVAGERVLPLQPLPVRDDGREGYGDDAVALFLDRAEAPVVGSDAVADVVRICQRLDGLPLAVELAAQRAETFGITGLLRRLDAVLDLLERPTAATERRHATLRAVVEWSYSLLDQRGQQVLDALAVFDGDMGLDAAEAVARVVAPRSAAGTIAQLVDASLVLTLHRDGEVRYRMLEIVRQHGREQLDRRGLRSEVRAAHARAMGARAEQIRQLAAGPDEHQGLAMLGHDRDNLRAALGWLRTQDPPAAGRLAACLAEVVLYRPDVEVLISLQSAATEAASQRTADGAVLAAGARAAFLNGELDTCRQLANLALEAPGEGARTVLAAHSLAVFHLYAGDLGAARRWFQRSADVPGAEQTARMDALGGLALAACFAGDLATARELADELRITADLVGAATYRAFARYVEGEVVAPVADAEALGPLSLAIDLAVEAGADFVTGLASVALIAALVRLGRPDEALARMGPLLDLWRRAGTWTQQWTTLRQLADLVAGRDPGTALLLLDAADRDAAAPAVVGGERARLDGLRHRLTAEVGPTAAARAERLAATLTRTQVLDLARQALAPPPHPAR
jgi:predicted ATPase/DNA-binding SARP family transcriptional activator